MPQRAYGDPVQQGYPPQSPYGGPLSPSSDLQSPYAVPAPVETSNGFAIAGFILGILPGSLIGFVFSILGIKRAAKAGGKGRGLAIAGLVFSLLWTAFILFGVFANSGTGRRLVARIDPGCTAAENYLAQFDREITADRNDAGAYRADITNAIGVLKADADKSNSTGAKADMRAFAKDLQERLDDINSDRQPSADLSARLEKDGSALDTDCGVGDSAPSGY